MKTVVPDDSPPLFSGHRDLERLRQIGELVVYDTRVSSSDDLAERLCGAIAAINVRAYSHFDAPLLDRLPELEIISISGTGTDNADLVTAADRGIVVCNTPGANAAAVAELCFGLLLAVVRGIPQSQRRFLEWYHHNGPELEGKTLGLLGLGLIGQRVARMAHGFNMRVVSWSFHQDPERAAKFGVELVERDDLFRQSDFISIHLRNTPEAAKMVGAREIELMKPSSFLVNTARGAIVDEAALADALRRRRIAGAALDVFTVEPQTAASPFLGLDNVVLSPHSGGTSFESNERSIIMPIDNILNYLAGKPTFVVNPRALEHPRQRTRL